MFLSSLKWLFRSNYEIIPGASSVDEGSSITYTVNTSGISNQTLYWTVNTNGSSAAADFSAVSGSFSLTSNTGSFSVTLTADATTEGSETFYVEIRTGSIAGTIVASTKNSPTTINDTSLTPAAAFSTAPTSIDETGTAITYSVTTTNYPSGTLYWTINHGTTAAADFSTTSGSFAIASSAGSFTITPLADATTEGAQTFTISVRLTSITGTILATTSTITINDTSLSPAASFSAVAGSVNEGSAASYTVTTTNFPSGTLYWTVNHVTTAAADFSAVSGSFTITAGTGTFSVTTVADVMTEGAETFTVSVRLTSISGTILATSSPATTINDTSLTVPGQLTNTSAGSVSWVCPATVSKVSVVCIGGGGGGVGFNSTTIVQGGAGGGGACSYVNNITVTPSTTYYLYLPVTTTGYSGGNPYFGATGTGAGNGSYAMFGTTNAPATSLCTAGGGHGGRGGTTEATPPYTAVKLGGKGGGNPTLDNSVGTMGQGGNGGDGNALVAAGGGGAGGYLAGAGGVGAGQNSATPTAGTSGGGSGGTRSTTASTTGGMGGGGSILGTSPGGGTLFGQGGAAGFGVSGLRGGNGGIRVVWPGQTRSYPATNVQDL